MHIRRSAFSVLFTGLLIAQTVIAQTTWPTKGWPLTTPQAAGLDPKALAALDADFAAGKYGYRDGLLIIRHGKIAYERRYKRDYDRIYEKEARTPSALNAHDPSGPYNYFNTWWHPFYQRGDLHTMQSVTKTVTSAVIGSAIGRKEFPSIDTPILKFFDESKVANIDDRKRRLTIRHLLTMTAGFDWNEDLPYADPNNTGSAMEASFDWVKYTIDRPMGREPGKSFQYNSGATQILSHIIRVATGKDVEEYAAEHLFAPLGIDHWFWKRSPTGLADTEGGLYLTPRDLAKIAYLYLHNGMWGGKSVVPSDWVKASIAPAVSVPGRSGVMYGYKWWLYPYGTDRKHYAFGGSGFGGQIPLVLPEYDLIVVFTGWTIFPDRSILPWMNALERVVAAVTDARSKTPAGQRSKK